MILLKKEERLKIQIWFLQRQISSDRNQLPENQPRIAERVKAASRTNCDEASETQTSRRGNSWRETDVGGLNLLKDDRSEMQTWFYFWQ